MLTSGHTDDAVAVSVLPYIGILLRVEFKTSWQTPEESLAVEKRVSLVGNFFSKKYFTFAAESFVPDNFDISSVQRKSRKCEK